LLSSVTHQIRHYVILIIVTLNHGHVVKQSTCHTDLGGTSFYEMKFELWWSTIPPM